MAKFTEAQRKLLAEFGEMADAWANGGCKAAIEQAEKELGWQAGTGKSWVAVIQRVTEMRAPIDASLEKLTAALPCPPIRESIWAEGSPEKVYVPRPGAQWHVYEVLWTEGHDEWPADWSKKDSQIRREHEAAEKAAKAAIFGSPEFWAAQGGRLEAKRRELSRR